NIKTNLEKLLTPKQHICLFLNIHKLAVMVISSLDPHAFASENSITNIHLTHAYSSLLFQPLSTHKLMIKNKYEDKK
ncbi:hypothetical protein ACMBCN_00805, partial [Candidatus Liberibacter asiaticus]|nr:hypothetical protein [Candidatus Liberibacter asiaticus]